MDYMRDKYGFCHRDLHPGNILLQFDVGLFNLLVLQKPRKGQSTNKDDDFSDLLNTTIQKIIRQKNSPIDENTPSWMMYYYAMKFLIKVEIIDFDLSKLGPSKIPSPANYNVKKLISNHKDTCSRVVNGNFWEKNIKQERIMATAQFRNKFWLYTRGRFPESMLKDADLYAWGQLYTALLGNNLPDSKDKPLNSFYMCVSHMNNLFKELSEPPKKTEPPETTEPPKEIEMTSMGPPPGIIAVGGKRKTQRKLRK